MAFGSPRAAAAGGAGPSRCRDAAIPDKPHPPPGRDQPAFRQRPPGLAPGRGRTLRLLRLVAVLGPPSPAALGPSRERPWRPAPLSAPRERTPTSGVGPLQT